MPVQACQLNSKNGFKYGESGKCYTYSEGNEQSKKAARVKAALQGRAIEASKNKKS